MEAYVCAQDLVDSSQADVVCFQETKVQSISRGTIVSMLGSWDHCYPKRSFRPFKRRLNATQ
jgi:exonuclease III